MNTELICPACGSTEISRLEKENFDQLTLGSRFSFKEICYKCASCHEEGDFFAETDNNYSTAQEQAKNSLVKNILEKLSEAGITMATFERVFELPARTLTRWKTGNLSHSALALLRIVITYPWILAVAENRFERNSSRCAVIKAAAQEFESVPKIQNSTPYQPSTASSGASSIFIVKVNNQQTKIKSIESSY